ncbi:MAG: class I SAM-dependent methyltransferase [Caldilineaceae bacterium]
MNFFGYQSAAERYAHYRPYFHPLVIEQIKLYLQLVEPVAQAVDVGCGTGQSTFALKAIARSIIGVDLSAAMLAAAPQDPAIQYIEAPAEAIPLPAASADLLTTSLAFHWFDQPRFWAEAQRLLKAQGWLVIYNNGFAGQMKENPAFAQWSNQIYLNCYPSPPRHQQPLTVEEAQVAGFHFAHQTRYENEVEFSVEELAAYLTTQSNVIAAVEQGKENWAEVYSWLVGELTPFFVTDKATFTFGGYIWYLQKRATL